MQRIGPSEVACFFGAQLLDALAPDESHRWGSHGSWLDHFRLADYSPGTDLVFRRRSPHHGARPAVNIMTRAGRSASDVANSVIEHFLVSQTYVDLTAIGPLAD